MDLFTCTACLRQRCIRFLVAMFFVGYLFYPSVHHLMPVTRPVVAEEATPSRVHIDSCRGVLSDALLSKDDHPWFFVNGCTLHNYTEKEAKTCMRTISSAYGVNSIGILGDSRTRNFFVGLTKILGKQDWNVPIPMRHADFNFYDRETDTLLFMRFRGKMDSEIYNDYVTWKESPSMLRPRVIVQGNALWDLTFGGTFEESSTNFRARAHEDTIVEGDLNGENAPEGNLSKTLPIMDAITPSTDILWMLQDPTDERKMDATNIGLRGSKLVDAYNKIAVDLLSKSHVKIWKTARDVALRFPDDSDMGGIHYSERVIQYKVQLFLNWYCNRHVTFEDGTCCSEPTRRNTLMFILPYLATILVVFLLSLVVLIVVIRKFRPPKPKIPLRDLDKLDYWKADAMGPLPRQ